MADTQPKDLGILFRADMVRAMLAGAKTRTRRIVNPQPVFAQVHEWRGKTLYDGEARRWFYGPHELGDVDCNRPSFQDALGPFCRYGPVGRRLWVREAFREGQYAVGDELSATQRVGYRADFQGEPALKWTPSIHMPRWASRLTLRVTSIRVERLTDITDADVVAEGFPHAGLGDTATDFVREFRRFRGLDESADPWVWVVGFERVEVARD